jgi:signal transduction histidine kinase
MRTPLSRLPIRLRLATAVALVTFVIFVVVGTTVGVLVAHKLRSDFNGEVTSDAQNVLGDIRPDIREATIVDQALGNYAALDNAVAIVIAGNGRRFTPSGQPSLNLGPPSDTPHQADGYMIATATGNTDIGPATVQFGLPVTSLNSEIGRLELVLAVGVIAGTLVAFGAGAIVARRAIAPIAELTAAAAEIERTGDPSLTLPEPTADDEVAELTHTLSGMLASLGEARRATEATLDRERAFVADASHELRTPLTSLLANLELLVESGSDEDREIHESALRSTQRMRRLVADLLLLARADAGQRSLTKQVDLADILIAAAGELKPSSQRHLLQLDAQPAPLVGVPDDLMRLVLNLLDNAIRHTPPGTHITASTRRLADGSAELVVTDNGPGIDPFLREHMFKRFVRGSGEVAGSSGLGLAIAAAVTQTHNGSIEVTEPPGGGSQFLVHLRGASEPQSHDDDRSNVGTDTQNP